jgi:hypothetical protein
MRATVLLGVAFCSAPSADAMEVYGAWHCGDDMCLWGTARDMVDFDTKIIG